MARLYHTDAGKQWPARAHGETRIRLSAGAGALGGAPLQGADAFRERVARSEILFMGLSFTSAHPQIPRTGTPARLTDFLAAERPLLVHAPPDSHLARYCPSLWVRSSDPLHPLHIQVEGEVL